MSFLSSVREAASAGLKMAASMASGTSLPFEQGPQITSYQGIMKMYSGKRENKEGVKEIVSIFMYDLKNKKSDEELALVKNAQRRLRTIKHPYLLRCIDAGEQLDNKGGGIIWIVTEPVQPLEDVIDNLREAPGSIAWGTYTLAAAIKFLNIDCNIVHGQVCMSSLFVDKGMDWKLGGFELLVTAPEANPAYFARAKDVLPKRYQSPEISRGQPEQLEALQRIPVAADWWALGCTVFEVWCGTIKSPSDLKNMSGMPEALRPDFVRMLQSSPAGRLRPAELLSNPVFEDDYVSLHIFLETLNVKDAIEKDRFFTKLAERVPALPKPAAQWKVLPALNNSLEFGGGSARALEPLLKIANVLSEEEYQEQVVPTIIKLFANTDRQMRLPLLERLPSMVEHLSKKVINESIFQPLAMGFVDTSVILREMTVKSIVTIAPKLSSGTMQHVMRAFAKLQLDEEAAIRTNTTICLGKIAAHIDAPTREKVLIPACCRALKDPFPPGRAAGLMSLTATQQYHSPMDVATKIVPNVAPMVLDVEKDVREAALTCMRIYMQRLEHAAQQLSLPPEQRKELQAPEQKTPDLSDPAAAVSWLTSTVTNAVKEAVKEQTGGSAPKAAAGSAAGAPAGYGTVGGASAFGRLFNNLFNRTASITSAFSSTCVDGNLENCKTWAEDGECEKNPAYMRESCKRSCGMCGGFKKPNVRIGCNDEEGYECEQRAAKGECHSNKGEMLIRCMKSCDACRWKSLLQDALGCEDKHNSCVMWKDNGECTRNPGYMMDTCPVACEKCASKRASCDRPPNTPPTVLPGDINRTMTRIWHEFPQYDPKPLSWPGGPHGPNAPWVMSLRNFVSDEEAEAFTSTCKQHFDRSLAGDQLSPVRTSYQCWCSGNECEAHRLTQIVAERIANVTRSQVRYMEPFQILKYEPGQFYKVHHDQNSGLFTPQGARVYTFFMYLNDVDEGQEEPGGGTHFADLGVVMPARKGHAVLWPSVMDAEPDRDEPMTNHEGLPPKASIKYASNVWIHNYDYRTPANANCLLTHRNTH